jgi:hypothetical protein
MKRIAAATAISLALVSGTAHAGGMAPAMEPAVIIEDTSSRMAASSSRSCS